MEMRRLGGTGVEVSSLCLGAMMFGAAGNEDHDDCVSIMHAAFDAGVNFVDTADVYSRGESEEIVGKAIAGRRDDIVLATKVHGRMGDRPNKGGNSRRWIIEECENSLRRLGTDHIDLLYMHCWDPLTPIEESLAAFDGLVSSGKVRAIGVSNFKAWQLMKALGISEYRGWARFAAAQYQYSLVARDIEREYVDLCRIEGVGIVPWSPLGGGFLSGKYRRDRRPMDAEEGRLATQSDQDEEAWHRRDTEQNWRIVDTVTAVAEELGATVSQVALAWLLAKPGVTSAVVGVRTMEQLDDNLGAAEIDLPAEAMENLDEASAADPGYPYRFLETYGSRTP